MSLNNHIWNYEKVKERSLGQDAILSKVMRSFLNDTEVLFSQLCEAIESGNLEKIRFLAHSLKGSSANVSASELSETAKRIEHLAKSGLLEDIQTQTPKLHQCKDELFSYVDEYLKYVSSM